MKIKNQNGFGVIEILLLVVVIAIASFGGYYVAHHQDKKTVVNSYATCVTANGVVQQSYPTKCTADGKSYTNPNQKVTSPSASTKTYLTIAEWGVKMQTTKESSDSYYVFTDATGGNSQQYLNLDSKDLDALTAFDGTSCKGEYIAIIGRYANDDPALTSTGIDAAIGARKTVGNYTYTFNTHKQYAAACLFDANANPIVANTAVYNAKVSAYTTMYDTISAE